MQRKGLIDYEMSIAIENASLDGYFTEKINDCFITLTMPIYYGAPDIENYFPDKAMIRMEELDSSAVANLTDYINEKIIDMETINALEYSRELLLTKYNLWNVVTALVNKLDD